MNTPQSSVRSDEQLLHLAETILSEESFYVEEISADVKVLVAENPYFILAVAATNTIGNLLLAEPIAFEALAHRIESVALGPKKWDTYLVLLTQEKSAEDDEVTRDLYAINYDTSQLRRIAHTGVDPTREAVKHALAPFVEPEAAATAQTSSDAVQSLLRALISRGVDEDLANRAIDAFEQGAVLDDVL